MSLNPLLEVASSLSSALNGSVITPQQAKEVYRLRQYKGELNIAERRTLIPAMQKLCQGLPIHRVKAVDVNLEEFDAGRINILNGTGSNSRKKRFWTTCTTEDRCTLKPIHGGRYCIWYNCKTSDVGGGCDIEHVRSGRWKCVICCKGETDDPPMCACDEVIDEESFVRCQKID